MIWFIHKWPILKPFCEYDCTLRGRRDMQDLDMFKAKFFSYKMNINLNLLCTLILDRIMRQINCWTLSQHTIVARIRGKSSSTRRLSNQVVFATVLRTPYYSASVLLYEIVACRLEDQDGKFFSQENIIFRFRSMRIGAPALSTF